MYPVSSIVKLHFFFLTKFAFQSVSLSLVELVFLHFFTFWLSFSMIPYFCISLALLPLVSTPRHMGKSHSVKRPQIGAFKHPSACESTSWNVHTVRYFMYYMWMNTWIYWNYLELSALGNLKRNKWTEKN